MRMRKTAAVIALATLGACASPPAALAPELLSKTVSASQDAVMTNAARVLAAHGFVLAPMDRATGVVQSQQLEVTDTWEGVPVTDRVDCGSDGIQPRAKHNPVQITLGVITAPSDRGTTVSLKPTVTGHNQAARELGATNVWAAASSGTYTCQLVPAFVESLMLELTPTQ